MMTESAWISTDDLGELLEIISQTASWADVRITSLAMLNWMGDTPLHTVCTWGELKPVELLLANGAQIDAIGDKGATPLFNAVMSKNPLLIEMLLKCGADPTIRNEWGDTPARYADTLGFHELAKCFDTSKAKRRVN